MVFAVETVMTTEVAVGPGVTGAEGLNAHCAPDGSPEQESVSALAKVEPGGFGPTDN